jgi:integrase
MRVVDAWHTKDRRRTARYGKGLRWIAMWREDPARPERKKSFRTRDDAQAFLDRIQRDRHEVLVTGRKPVEPVRVADWITTWRARQVHQREGSLAKLDSVLTNHVVPVLGARWLGEVSRGDVQDAVTAWKGVLKPRTVKEVYAFVTQIFRDAVDDGLIVSSPCRRINLPEIQADPLQVMTTGQVEALRLVMREGLRDAVVVAAGTGLRPGEWRGLTADRVDLGRGVIRVDRQLVSESTERVVFGPPKTRSGVRTVRVGDRVAEVLAGLVESPRGPEGLLFGTQDGGLLRRARVSEAWRRASKQLEFDPGRGWHALRHYHASLLIAGGASPVAVAHRLGHRDATETLRTYAHLWVDDDERMASLGDWAG